MLADPIIEPLITDAVVPGIAVGLVEGDRVERKGYGTVSLANPAPTDADTVFEIGSITKVFTGILLADCVVRGEVRLEDPVADFLPDTVRVPQFEGAPITLLDLATQTSGLPRLPTDLTDGQDPTDPYAHYDADRLCAFLSGYSLLRKPGAQYEYSNLGLGLLGYALARRVGLTYEALVRQRLCLPLDLTCTAITLTSAMRARWADGYKQNGEATSPWDLNVLAGAGGLRSSIRDLVRFTQANLGAFPSALGEALDLAQQPRRPGPGEGARQMALGWHTWRDADILWHNGETGGYTSFLAIDRARQRGVVILCNRGGFNPAAIGERLLQAMDD